MSYLAKRYMPKMLSPDEVKRTSVGELRKQYNAIAEYLMKINDRDLIYCPVCDDFHSTFAFYQDKRYPNGFYPECKESVKKQALDYNKKTGVYTDNTEKTIEVLRKLDLVFNESIIYIH